MHYEKAATGADRPFIPYEVPLDGGRRAKLRLPADLTREEADRLCGTIRALAFTDSGDTPGSEKTEWGVRYAPNSEQVVEYGSTERAELEARRVAREYARHGKVLVCRTVTVTYGPWVDTPDSREDESG